MGTCCDACGQDRRTGGRLTVVSSGDTLCEDCRWEFERLED